MDDHTPPPIPIADLWRCDAVPLAEFLRAIGLAPASYYELRRKGRLSLPTVAIGKRKFVRLDDAREFFRQLPVCEDE